jgi:hypothetical protein
MVRLPTNLSTMEDQATNETAANPAPEDRSPAAATAEVFPPGGAVGGEPEPARTPAIPGAGQAEWPARVADTIEDVVEAVHDRVVRPLALVARGLVFGIIIGVMAIVLSVLAAVALVRVLDVYAFGGRVWASDAVLGGVLVLAGALAWSKRGTHGAEEG